MRNRTVLLIVSIIVIGLLAIGGTVGVMALTHSGFMGNGNGNGNGMMGGQQGYQRTMGGYQQGPVNQGAPVTRVNRMNMQNSTYQYTNIQVRVDTTVTWTNRDNVPQSVTFQNGMMDSGLLSQGQSFSYTFNMPGTYHYYSSAHQNMVATVTVVP